MKAQDFVRATAAYHDELSPAAWNGTEMRPEVRVRLIEIAQLFVEYLDVEGFEVYDVVLTGSLANYNWTEYSDFDLHVVTDYKDLQCDDLAEAFYRAKKTIWNNQHDITIYNHEVELYVEDINEPPVSGGVFSVLNGEWLKTPDHKNPNINDTAIVRKVQEFQDQIERSIATADDPEDLKRLTDKLRNMRQAGLADGGEFSVENLAFKTLRNMGIIKALHDAYIEKQDDTMRISEVTENFEPAQPGQLVSIIQAPRILDLLPGETFEVRSSNEQGVTLKHGMGTKFDNVVFPHGTYKIVNAQGLREFAPDEGGEQRKFIPWTEFIEQLKEILKQDFSCKENVVKSTIKARFVPHDPMEYGPTMLYSYYETRAGGRNKGAISTRGSIQVGKYTKGGLFGQAPDQLLTGFNLLKGHPFERHFDLTFENIYKIANIIKGNREGAYVMQNNNTAA